MEEKELFGKLFNSVPLLTDDHLQTLLDVMDREQAIFMLVQAVKYAYMSGVYSIGEVEVISKSIRILNRLDLDDNKGS